MSLHEDREQFGSTQAGDNCPVVEMTPYPEPLRRRLERGYRKYDFKICQAVDWPRLKDFLRQYWGEQHPYVVSDSLLRWQMYNAEQDIYNFLYAEHRESGRIHSCLGCISTRHFDRDLPFLDAWPGLWVSAPEAAAGLGSECAIRYTKQIRARSLGVVGLTAHTRELIPRMGWTIDTMQHHYLLHPAKQEFRLVAGVEHAPSRPAFTDTRCHFTELTGAEVLSIEIEGHDATQDMPMKSPRYLYNRYIQHPVYRYRLFAIVHHQRVIGCLVTRLAHAHDACALRIVDYVGREEGLAGIADGLLRLLEETGAEYADLYSGGLSPDVLKRSGLVPHPEGDPVIIPNYFEPFEQRNKTLHYGYILPPGGHYRMFKGDSDQDRPNQVGAMVDSL